MSRKRLIWVRILGLLCLILLPVIAGLAFFQPWHRPQTTPHPTIEYVLVPGTTYAGFARTSINSRHMRAEEADTFPVLVIGDSVVLGWARIDQSDIATSLLTERLGVPVGNIAASGWGLPNQLAFVQEFGLFGAKVVAIVVSSHDVADVPGLLDQEEPREEASAAFTTLLRTIREAGAEPIVALHREVDELAAQTVAGHEAFRSLAIAEDTAVVELMLPKEAYMDFIHPNANGQSLIADQLENPIRRLLDHR